MDWNAYQHIDSYQFESAYNNVWNSGRAGMTSGTPFGPYNSGGSAPYPEWGKSYNNAPPPGYGSPYGYDSRYNMPPASNQPNFNAWNAERQGNGAPPPPQYNNWQGGYNGPPENYPPPPPNYPPPKDLAPMAPSPSSSADESDGTAKDPFADMMPLLMMMLLLKG